MPHVQAGDLRVHYREWTPREWTPREWTPREWTPREWTPAAPQGLPVVFVHGNWSTYRWWIPTAEQLTRRMPHQRLIALDLRGRGDTQGPDHGYSIPELAGDLLAFLDALALARVHLVGHSLGTAIAAELALTAPERVASLVSVAPCWVDGMPEQWARREDQARVHADRELYARILAGMAPAAARDAAWDEIVVTGHRQREVATLRNLDALIAWRPGDRLRELAMPRVVIDGEHDPLCGGSTAARAAEAMACERVCLAGIGHSPNLEAPDLVASIIHRVIRVAETS